jgi:hypothetical protein
MGLRTYESRWNNLHRFSSRKGPRFRQFDKIEFPHRLIAESLTSCELPLSCFPQNFTGL